MARICNLILLAMEARGLSLSFSGKGWKPLVFYTVLSNLMAALSSALLLLFGQTGWVAALRYLSICMLVMTFFVTTCVLIPQSGELKAMLFSGSCLYHHLLCPVLATLSYLLWERHAGAAAIWLPVGVTLVYGSLMLCLNYRRRVDGPYPFFKVYEQSAAATVLWFIALLAAVSLLSAGVWLLGK